MSWALLQALVLYSNPWNLLWAPCSLPNPLDLAPGLVLNRVRPAVSLGCVVLTPPPEPQCGTVPHETWSEPCVVLYTVRPVMSLCAVLYPVRPAVSPGVVLYSVRPVVSPGVVRKVQGWRQISKSNFSSSLRSVLVVLTEPYSSI